jgi:FADH2 O2-dependent halogenase
VAYRDRTEIIRMRREMHVWEIAARRNDRDLRFTSSWVVDATGSGNLLRDQLGIPSSPRSFQTNTYALFSHFRNVEPWSDWLSRAKIEQSDYPFNPDHSALHHLLDEGWMWMLRFNNGLASCGIVFNGNRDRINPGKSSTEQWDRTLAAYPSLQNMFRIANVAEPPGAVITSKRLQRCAERGVGEGWIALPHTIGFIDPLHSTGIAHTLSGVERIGHYFGKYGGQRAQLEYHLKQYEQAVFNELAFIDLLVSGCLDTTHQMELFTLYSMLYFTAAVTYEQLRLRGRFHIERHWFLSTNHPSIPDFVRARHKELQQLLTMETLDEKHIAVFRERIRQDIEPYNIAGLLRPEVSNMYRHSVAEL